MTRLFCFWFQLTNDLSCSARSAMNAVQALKVLSMVGKRQAKREDLRTRLMDAARDLIEQNGIRGLNARSVTTKAGCALGSLYTAFEDLDDLIVHVNSATLKQLGEFLSARVVETDEPVAVLKALAEGYVIFARENFPLWNALFEYADITMDHVPDWHQQDQALLIDFIKEPVMALSPHMGEEEARLRAKTMFAAVHGVVAFSLQERFIGIGAEELNPELNRFIDQMIAGLDRG